MLELLLFGTIEVHRAGVALHGLSAKGRLLLAYLTLSAGRAVASARLADAIFADSQAGDPHDLIKKTASEIRRFLGEEGHRLSSPAPRMLALDLAGVSVDWLEFRNAVRKGDPDSLQHAVTLHTRPFLEREPLYWVLEEQATCLDLRQQALETLAQQALENGDLNRAGNWFAQMLKFELPDVTLNEAVWRVFIEALLQRQEYGKIQLHYGRLQTFLERTAGRGLEAETEALYQLIPKSILLRMAQAGHRKPKRVLPDSARLPHFPFALLGRDTAKKEIMGAFKNARLVTVTGIGGVGKTRFAVQVGGEIAADYHDEVGFLDLSACAPTGVLQTVAAALGVQESGHKLLYTSLHDLLAPHRLLLIFDNCEHVVSEVAALVSDLMEDCPLLRLLLTSREMLRIAGEQVCALAPLALPDPKRGRSSTPTSPPIAAALDSPAVRLFVERATAVHPGFQLTPENAGIVETLCRLADGLPLGIEMVASQTAGAPLERVAADLSGSVLPLRHAKRGISPRHQTLHSMLDWSYGMLGEAERTLLRRLSVFAGGWTLEAAEQVCADTTLPGTEIARMLSELVTKSLVMMERSAAHALPFRFLETIRAYAAERLEESGETGRLEAAHCDYYLRLLTELDDASQIKAYLATVDRNRGNVYSAMQRSLDAVECLESGHRISLCLHNYWAHRALRSEGREWHRKLLNMGRETLPKEAVAASLLKISDYSAGLNQGDSAEAQDCLRRAFEIYREQGDRKGESEIYVMLGTRQCYTGQHAEAYANFQKACELYVDSDRADRRAFVLILMGGCLTNLGQHDAAEASQREALEIARSQNMPSLEALALMFRGFSARDRNLLELAEKYFADSVAVYESIASAWGVVRSRSNLADIKRRQGEFDEALELFYLCLCATCEFSTPPETVYILAHLAQLLHDRQEWAASLNLSAGLLHLSDTFPDALPAINETLQTAVTTAAAHLDPQEAEAILLEARTTDFDALLDYALIHLAPDSIPTSRRE